MSDDENDVGGFSQKETIDKPGIIGARWWQESIATEVPRRKAIKALLTFGGALGVIGAVGYLASRKHTSSPPSSNGATSTWSPDDATIAMKSALVLQHQFGWNFGATGDALVFDGTSTQPFDPASMARMTTDLAPANPTHTPFWVPTLFQSPSAAPTSTVQADPPFKPLVDLMRPVNTPTMALAFSRGTALANRIAGNARSATLALIVDLPGPDAVAFAAGAAGLFDPVFLFDNWPHPHGVVASHLTLGAALYYQPLFAKQRAQASAAMPMFVLDRNRLATYVDSQRDFDNRYTARLPSSSALATLKVDKFLYIGPDALDRNETDDLNDPFLLFKNSGTKFLTCPAMAFAQASTMDAGADMNLYYGGSAAKSAKFWTDWDRTPPANTTVDEVMSYVPVPRKTAFSSGYAVPTTTAPRPPNFGLVPVAVATDNGDILGHAITTSSGTISTGSSGTTSSGWNGTYIYIDRRNGSWNRTNYGSSSS